MKPISLKNASYDNVPCCGSSYDGTPSVHLEFPEADAPELPEEGEITFKYKLRREVENHERGRCEYELDLREITKLKEGKSEISKSSEDILDDLRREVESD